MYAKTIAIILSAAACMNGGFTLAAQNTLQPASEQQIEQIVKQYILGHPEVVLESVKSFQQREEAAQPEQAKDSILTKEAELLRDAASPATGKSKADITIVEFFDYNCGYCKNVHSTVLQLLADNPRVR